MLIYLKCYISMLIFCYIFSCIMGRRPLLTIKIWIEKLNISYKLKLCCTFRYLNAHKQAVVWIRWLYKSYYNKELKYWYLCSVPLMDDVWTHWTECIYKYLHLYFHCFNILYRTNEVHSSMNTVSLITAQRYGKHLWRQEFPAIFRMLLF